MLTQTIFFSRSVSFRVISSRQAWAGETFLFADRKHVRDWPGLFLETPGDLTGPKSYFEISPEKSRVCSDL